MKNFGIEADQSFGPPAFDTGWFMINRQVAIFEHGLNTKNFSLVTLQGANSINGHFPSWEFVTSHGNDYAGNFVQATKNNEITVGQVGGSNIIIDPNLNWTSCEAKFIRVRIWV